jgi:hypothetical protein
MALYDGHRHPFPCVGWHAPTGWPDPGCRASLQDRRIRPPRLVGAGESWEPGRRIDSKRETTKRQVLRKSGREPRAPDRTGPTRTAVGCPIRGTSTSSLEEAGREVITVNPRHTSQRCFCCGHVAAENRDRQKFLCVSCGYKEHAELNAARNIWLFRDLSG